MIRGTLSRLHVAANVVTRDAAVYDPAYDSAFDAVLLDAPCSGLGLLAGKPDLRYNKREEDIAALVEIQAALLDTCSRYVRPGGMLVYATCTISLPENERQTEAFLARNKMFSPSPLPFFPEAQLQLLPHVHGTEGFYLARMQRCI